MIAALPNTRIVAVIPARLGSTRLPRKVLREVAGRPLLQWVYEAASACSQFDEVVVAVDSDEVAEVGRVHGWRILMTSPHLPSGTDRLHAVSRSVEAGIYVNVQGDEPMLTPEHIDAILAPFVLPHVEATTLKVLCRPEDIANPNVVKVTTAMDGRALYFSRAPIPYPREPHTPAAAPCYKHLGLYAYRKHALERFASLEPSPLELTERLEQLRLLENNLSLYVAEAPFDTVGVDTEEDLARVDSLLRAAHRQP